MKYCTNGSKSVVRRTFILMGEEALEEEEALEIKKHLNIDEFLTFTASNGWQEKWKISYGSGEKRVNGKAGEVSGETINAWMERLLELTKDYDPVDIWNMDETGCFFKALPEKGLAEKKSQTRGGKKI